MPRTPKVRPRASLNQAKTKGREKGSTARRQSMTPAWASDERCAIACPALPAALGPPQRNFGAHAMTGYIAIGIIVLFVCALGALNLYEFGRFD